MFIELIDALRCTSDHADSWLVASISRRTDRFLTEGTLGCHVCKREYAVRDGVVWFDEPDRNAGSPELSARDVGPQLPGTDMARQAAAREDAVRVGAFLAVADGSVVLLAGDWARAAHALSELVPSRSFVLNPAEPVEESESVGVIMSGEGIPLAPSSLRGVALDAANAAPGTVASAVKILVPGGRLVAPAGASVPSGISVLARDDNFWVGEKGLPLLTLVHR